MLTYFQRLSEAYTWEQFPGKYSRYHSAWLFEKYILKLLPHLSDDQWVKARCSDEEPPILRAILSQRNYHIISERLKYDLSLEFFNRFEIFQTPTSNHQMPRRHKQNNTRSRGYEVLLQDLLSDEKGAMSPVKPVFTRQTTMGSGTKHMGRQKADMCTSFPRPSNVCTRPCSALPKIRARYPSGHYWDYYFGTLSWNRIIETHLRIRNIFWK